MPKEEFDKCQKLSRELKQAIKDEEQAIKETEKEITNEKQRGKKLGREKHEIEAQHTLARLDVEIPALEAEHMELQGVHDEFSEILAALQAQLDDMEGSLQIEIRHRKRLIRCIAKMLKALETRGAKQKLLSKLKLIIKYKGEEPPPKPAPVPTADSATESPTETKQQQDSEAKVSNDDEDATEQKDNSKVSEAPSVSASSRTACRQADPSEAGATGESNPLRKGRRPSGSKLAKARESPSERSKQDKSSDSTEDCRAVPPAMDWGGRRKCMSSKSPARDEKKRSKSRDKEEAGFSWADMQKVDQQKKSSASKIKRSKSADLGDLVKGKKLSKEKKMDMDMGASFNWEALATANDAKGDKDK